MNPYIINAEEQPLMNYKLDDLLSLVRTHKLVLLKNIKAITRDNLLTYCQSQAELLSWDFGPVMEMKVAEDAKNYLFTPGDVPLHWDGAFHQEPRFLVFHCIEAPPVGTGGETLFVNTESVWDKASTLQQQQWSELNLQFATEKLAHYGGTITRTLVNKHPDTQHSILRFAEPVGDDYLNPVQVQVMDKTQENSAVILSDLSKLMRQAEHVYQHAWEENDLLIADNFSLLHGRNSFKEHSPRHLRRIQLL